MTPGESDRGRATRAHLVEVAKELFAQRGYEATSIEAILTAAGISRGALYHHFDTKLALFEAVFESVEDDVGRQLQEASAGMTDATSVLRAGSRAWVRMARAPVVQQIVLIDAPSVLGWNRWREIEEAHALGGLKVALGLVADEGKLAPELVEMFAHVLLAATNELALFIARADDPEAAQREGEAAVDELLRRLLRA